MVLKGVIVDPERPKQELKHLECANLVCMSSEEGEKLALTFCKAWIDRLRPQRSAQRDG